MSVEAERLVAEALEGGSTELLVDTIVVNLNTTGEPGCKSFGLCSCVLSPVHLSSERDVHVELAVFDNLTGSEEVPRTCGGLALQGGKLARRGGEYTVHGRLEVDERLLGALAEALGGDAEAEGRCTNAWVQLEAKADVIIEGVVELRKGRRQCTLLQLREILGRLCASEEIRRTDEVVETVVFAEEVEKVGFKSWQLSENLLVVVTAKDGQRCVHVVQRRHCLLNFLLRELFVATDEGHDFGDNEVSFRLLGGFRGAPVEEVRALLTAVNKHRDQVDRIVKAVVRLWLSMELDEAYLSDSVVTASELYWSTEGGIKRVSSFSTGALILESSGQSLEMSVLSLTPSKYLLLTATVDSLKVSILVPDIFAYFKVPEIADAYALPLERHYLNPSVLVPYQFCVEQLLLNKPKKQLSNSDQSVVLSVTQESFYPVAKLITLEPLLHLVNETDFHISVGIRPQGKEDSLGFRMPREVFKGKITTLGPHSTRESVECLVNGVIYLAFEGCEELEAMRVGPSKTCRWFELGQGGEAGLILRVWLESKDGTSEQIVIDTSVAIWKEVEAPLYSYWKGASQPSRGPAKLEHLSALLVPRSVYQQLFQEKTQEAVSITELLDKLLILAEGRDGWELSKVSRLTHNVVFWCNQLCRVQVATLRGGKVLICFLRCDDKTAMNRLLLFGDIYSIEGTDKMELLKMRHMQSLDSQSVVYYSPKKSINRVSFRLLVSQLILIVKTGTPGNISIVLDDLVLSYSDTVDQKAFMQITGAKLQVKSA